MSSTHASFQSAASFTSTRMPAATPRAARLVHTCVATSPLRVAPPPPPPPLRPDAWAPAPSSPDPACDTPQTSRINKGPLGDHDIGLHIAPSRQTRQATRRYSGLVSACPPAHLPSILHIWPTQRRTCQALPLFFSSSQWSAPSAFCSGTGIHSRLARTCTRTAKQPQAETHRQSSCHHTNQAATGRSTLTGQLSSHQ